MRASVRGPAYGVKHPTVPTKDPKLQEPPVTGTEMASFKNRFQVVKSNEYEHNRTGTLAHEQFKAMIDDGLLFSLRRKTMTLRRHAVFSIHMHFLCH